MDAIARDVRGGMMPIYHVHVILDVEYDDIEADSEEEAFLIASDAAMSGGSWEWTVTQDEVEE